MKLVHAIPALPVSDVGRGAAFYRDRLGFTLVFAREGFAKLQRDAVELHLWAAADEGWRGRDLSAPVVSGAESFIAGTASCRIRVEDCDALYRALEPLGVLHGHGALKETPWGTREFAVVDPDNNLITFFEPAA